MKIATSILAAVTLASPAVCMAQAQSYDSETEDSSTKGRAITFVRVSAADKAILEKDKPKGPHEIPVPNFVLKTRNNAFMMTIGGQINTIMGWDLGNNLYTRLFHLKSVAAFKNPHIL